MSGTGHPLPGSDEARHHEIPEHLEREKGRGDDPKSVVQPSADPVTPDGEPYRYADLGRGPEAQETEMNDRQHDRGEAAADTPRDQPQAGIPGGGRQLGGGPSASDMAAPGGSSGSGGYGNTDEQQQQQGAASPGGHGDEIAHDQAAHQDRGQSSAERESDGG